MNRFAALVLVILVAGLLGCGGGGGASDGGGTGIGPTLTSIPGPGAFSLAQVSQQLSSVKGKILTQAEASPSLSFDVGNIKSSTSLFFLLGNSGELPITDIKLTTGNPNFTLTPGTIDRLEGVGSMSIAPILKVFISHGTAQSGVGFTDPLPMGATRSAMVISGKTTDSAGKPSDVSVSASIKVFADYVDFDLLDGTVPVDFSNPAGTGAGYSVGDGVLMEYHPTDPKMKNLGNATFTVHCLNDGFNGNYSEITYFDVSPGDTKDLIVFPPELVRIDIPAVSIGEEETLPGFDGGPLELPNNDRWDGQRAPAGFGLRGIGFQPVGGPDHGGRNREFPALEGDVRPPKGQGFPAPEACSQHHQESPVISGATGGALEGAELFGGQDGVFGRRDLCPGDVDHDVVEGLAVGHRLFQGHGKDRVDDVPRAGGLGLDGIEAPEDHFGGKVVDADFPEDGEDVVLDEASVGGDGIGSPAFETVGGPEVEPLGDGDAGIAGCFGEPFPLLGCSQDFNSGSTRKGSPHPGDGDPVRPPAIFPGEGSLAVSAPFHRSTSSSFDFR